MRTVATGRTLRFKVAVGLLAPLVLTLAVFSYLEYDSQQRLLMADLERSAADAGQIIEGSFRHAMLESDFTMVERIMRNIGEQEGVRGLYLLDKEGRVLLSTDGGVVGTTMDLDDVTCQSCHRYEATGRNASIVLPVGGERLFRNVSTVENVGECVDCHASDGALGVLISDFDMSPIDRVLSAARRNSVLWSVASLALALLVVNVMVDRLITARLGGVVGAIRRVSQGDLDVRVDTGQGDEIDLLASSFNRMTAGLREKKALERSLEDRTARLQAQTERLSTLNALAATVNRSLDLDEILSAALEEVLALVRLEAGWIVLRDDGRFDVAASRGLPEGMAATPLECSLERGRCLSVMESGRSQVFRHDPHHACPAARRLRERRLLFRVCVPLRSRRRLLGIMSLAGGGGDGELAGQLFGEETLDLLTAIGQQIGIAVENASLYEELRQKEAIRRQLLERMISVEEEQRGRIARELHDETSQSLTSLLVELKLLEEVDSVDTVREHIRGLREAVDVTLAGVHRLALELRPSVLDDLGLIAALRRYTRDYQDKYHLPVDLQVLGLDAERLSPHIETALYRMAQEALTNVARHAEAQGVSLLLERRRSSVVLIVEDDGCGFDVDAVLGSSVREENLGLHGLRERAALLGGTLIIESTIGVGTAVFAEIPLAPQENDHG